MFLAKEQTEWQVYIHERNLCGGHAQAGDRER